ncbi:MAG TPA: hypothetical protein VFZ65_19980 [Planctomycetota bacterium]|nr:hypothetical protein [Planctomycetota bacterium]
MSIHEIGVVASLVTTVVVYAIFFGCTASGAVQGADQIGLFIGLVVAQIVALVCIHIALAICRGTQEPDERDAFIALRSFRNAYVVLTSSVTMVTIGYLLWGGIASEPDATAAGVAGPSVALVGNAILLCFVLAEVTKSGTQLVLYRKGGL